MRLDAGTLGRAIRASPVARRGYQKSKGVSQMKLDAIFLILSASFLIGTIAAVIWEFVL